MDNRYKRLGKNTALVFLGNAGSKLIGLIMLPFYTRFMSTSDYGTSDLISTYSAILIGFVSCCIADAIFIFPKDADEKGRRKYYSSGLFFAFSTFLICATLFALLYFLNNKFSIGGTFFDMIWWLFAFAISDFFQNYTQQFTRSIDRMAIYSLSGIVLTIAMALLALALMPKYGLRGYLISMVAAKFVAAFFSIIASKSYVYFSIHSYDIIYLKKLLAYGIPLIPNAITWWMVNGVNRPIMESSLGLSAIGIYAVAGKLPSILSMLFFIFSNAWGISMLEEFGKADFNAFFNKTVKALLLVTIIGGCFLVYASKPITRLLAAPEFFEAWKYTPILTLGVLFQAMSGLVGGVFAAEKKSKYFFYSSMWGAAVSLGLTWPFIHFWGLYGAALAIASSFLCMFIVRLCFAWRHINLFDVKFFAILFLLYSLFVYIIILDPGFLIGTLSLVIVLAFILVLGKHEIESVYRMIVQRFNNNRE